MMDNHANKRNRYLLDRHHTMGTTGGPLSNTLYIPPLSCEVDVIEKWHKTLKKFHAAKAVLSGVSSNLVSTSSATSVLLPNNSVGYIFTDPPFGGNIMYSEVNFLWEAWLGVATDNMPEAIENEVQRKGSFEYQELMTRCFHEFYRVLKPGHWMTVEFHNSKNRVWNAIQEALQRAGFVIADVRVLDKKHTTIYQDHAAGAVKQDLVISAYKANGGLEERFRLEAGSADGVWDFVRTHLNQLPVFVQSTDGKAEVIAERQNYLLFDRMVAFHVQRGVSVPMSAPDFYVGLAQRLPERDGMYFLAEQVAEYERKRITVREVQQLQLFVSDEASARQWLRQHLINKPQTFQEIHPHFIQELRAWQKHEVQLELRDLLEQNFLSYEGDGPIPAQIVSWMKRSTGTRELLEAHGKEQQDGSVDASNPQLIARARDRWYVPNPNQAADLEKLRLKGLLREFATYREGKGRLKQFRTEAVRAGFGNAWGQKDYKTIVEMAERLPESVLQEDPALLMYYDNASLRVRE
jgi:hypothetical protein